jgi:hypothetical protein
MKRRIFMAGCAVGAVVATSSPRAQLPSYRVSAEQLQRLVAERFPARYAVADLFTLEVDAPRVRLLPQTNRVASEFALHAAGPALRHGYSGSFEVDFGLRYEPRDQTLRAHRLRAHSFRVPGLPLQALQVLDAYGQVVAQQALFEVVVHQLHARDLALPDAMGFEPGEITVMEDALVIGFVPKAQRRAS